MSKLKNPVRVLIIVLMVGLAAYIVAKSYSKGNDINVYLHAGSQIISGEDPYVENPFNNYLYSPLFALLMAPLTALGFPIARVFWALFNCYLLFRSWQIFERLTSIRQHIPGKAYAYFVGAAALLAFNAFNHNLILGQMTVLMLWIVIESLDRIKRGQWIIGALILALGINVKIIPMFALGYLFLAKEYRALAVSLAGLILFAVLPAFVLGWQSNLDLHTHWLQVIDPTKSKLGMEINDGCLSLNCMWSRIPAEQGLLKILTNISRLIVLILFTWYMFYRTKASHHGLDQWRTWSLILIAILLFFPHQMKYSMLFILPAALYFMKDVFKLRSLGIKLRVIHYLMAACFIIPAIIGRDIIGNFATDFFDTIGMMGFCVIGIFLGLIFDRSGSRAELES